MFYPVKVASIKIDYKTYLVWKEVLSAASKMGNVERDCY